jgi:kumamolisin
MMSGLKDFLPRTDYNAGMAKSELRLPVRNHRPRALPRGSKRIAIQGSARVQVTVVVRSKGSSAEWRKLVERSITGLPKEREYLTRAEFGKAWGASRADLAAVSAYGRAHGMKTVSDAWRRCVVFSGTIKQHQKAFGVELGAVRHPERNFITYRGTPKVGASIHPMVEAILGLDTRPTAHPHLIGQYPVDAPRQLKLPELREAYAFPRRARGKGQCVSVIELGGGFRRRDYHEYFARIGIKPPRLSIRTLPGATNDPAPPKEIRETVTAGLKGDSPPLMTEEEYFRIAWTCETSMDLQIVGTLAPKAKLLLVFGSNDDQGHYHAITSVLADARNAPSVISCSWGGPEGKATPAQFALDSWFQAAAVLGVTMCFAAGDAGDGTLGKIRKKNMTFVTFFPASSPYVLACGGTKLDVEARTEVAWRQRFGSTTMAGGGGFSVLFPRPPWQLSAGIDSADWIPANASSGTGRGVPDVSAKASFDPAFCYVTGGMKSPAGGTSAATPIWAALIAVLNEALGVPVGSINPLLYGSALNESLRDITRGNTGHLHARVGWDPSSGWGSPHGEAMLEVLAGR